MPLQMQLVLKNVWITIITNIPSIYLSLNTRCKDKITFIKYDSAWGAICRDHGGKTIKINLYTSPMIINKILCRINLLESFDTTKLIKISKVFKPINKVILWL